MYYLYIIQRMYYLLSTKTFGITYSFIHASGRFIFWPGRYRFNREQHDCIIVYMCTLTPMPCPQRKYNCPPAAYTLPLCIPLCILYAKISRYCYKHDIKMHISCAFCSVYAFGIHFRHKPAYPRGKQGSQIAGGLPPSVDFLRKKDLQQPHSMQTHNDYVNHPKMTIEYDCRKKSVFMRVCGSRQSWQQFFL